MNLKIRELRLENRLTQKELAKKIGSTDKNIWAYENGVAAPPIDILIACAQFFDVSTDYLLGLEDDFGQHIAPTADYNDEERKIIEDYRTLSPDLKRMVRETIRIYTGAGEKQKRKKLNGSI